jgi:hypothetical protein
MAVKKRRVGKARRGSKRDEDGRERMVFLLRRVEVLEEEVSRFLGMKVDGWSEARKEEAREKYRSAEACIRSLNEEVAELAKTVRPRSGGTRFFVRDFWESTYRTTGNGKHYARMRAEILAEGIRAHAGVERVEVTEAQFGFDVHAYLESSTDLEIVKRGGWEPSRFFVKECWARGVNPRVYVPFLEQGFEKANGLDFFGHDVSGWPGPSGK